MFLKFFWKSLELFKTQIESISLLKRQQKNNMSEHVDIAREGRSGISGLVKSKNESTQKQQTRKLGLTNLFQNIFKIFFSMLISISLIICHKSSCNNSYINYLEEFYCNIVSSSWLYLYLLPYFHLKLFSQP